jgi:hypothetical protein
MVIYPFRIFVSGEALSDESLDSAILRTVLYADVFDFALTVSELHRFLMYHTTVPLAEIERALGSSPVMQDELTRSGDLVALKTRDALFGVRHEREAVAGELWPLARRYAAALAVLPFVRMVALTGALAMRNPVSTQDDLDYLIVTRPGRVWLARLATVVLVRAVRLTGTEICPNFVLAEDSLAQHRRDVYIAHEVAQAVPFFGGALYDRLRAENRWTALHLPNAEGTPHRGEIRGLGRAGAGIKRALEWVLGGKLGDRIEAWEKARKVRRFESMPRPSDSAARVDDSQVKGHFNDHGGSVLAQYRRRLTAYGLTEQIITELAAD